MAFKPERYQREPTSCNCEGNPNCLKCRGTGKIEDENGVGDSSEKND